MPFEFGASLVKLRTLHTEVFSDLWDGGLPVDFYPNKVSDAESKMQEIVKNPPADANAAFEAILFDLVAGWDVTNAGEPVPFTHDGLASLGLTLPYKSAIIQAVVKEPYAGGAYGTRLRERLRNS